MTGKQNSNTTNTYASKISVQKKRRIRDINLLFSCGSTEMVQAAKKIPGQYSHEKKNHALESK